MGKLEKIKVDETLELYEGDIVKVTIMHHGDYELRLDYGESGYYLTTLYNNPESELVLDEILSFEEYSKLPILETQVIASMFEEWETTPPKTKSLNERIKNEANKRIFNTWQKRKLKLVGVYEFYVVDKTAIKLYRKASYKFFLAITSKDGKFEEVVEVSPKDFKNTEEGDSLGKCTLFRHKDDWHFHIIVIEENPETALEELTKKGKVEMGVLTFISIIIILSISQFI